MGTSQFKKAAFAVAAIIAIPAHILAQQASEGLLPSSPSTPCPLVDATLCAEVLTCDEVALVRSSCIPSCSPQLCDGAPAQRSLDVDLNCRVNENDAQAVTNELNRRALGRNPLPTSWFDVNGDGQLNSQDPLAILDALSAHGCIAPPPCSPLLCDGSRTEARFDANADCRVTQGDYVIVIDEINRRAAGSPPNPSQWFDVNRDGAVNSLDANAITTILQSRGCS
jgi:hypothetical protein